MLMKINRKKIKHLTQKKYNRKTAKFFCILNKVLKQLNNKFSDFKKSIN